VRLPGEIRYFDAVMILKREAAQASENDA